MNISGPALSKDKRIRLLNLLASKHSHSEMTQWAFCKECQDKMMLYRREKAKLTELELQDLHQLISQKAKEIWQLPQRQQQAIKEQIEQIKNETS